MITTPIIHTIPNIHAIHTIPTLYSKHSTPIIATIRTTQTIHTVIWNIPYPTDLHTIPTTHTIPTIHAIHTIPTIHTKHTIHSKHAIPDRPYTPQWGGGWQYYGWPMTMAGGEGGWNAGPHIYIYTHTKYIYSTYTRAAAHISILAPKQNHWFVLDCPSFVWASHRGRIWYSCSEANREPYQHLPYHVWIFSASLRQGVSDLVSYTRSGTQNHGFLQKAWSITWWNQSGIPLDTPF